MLQPPKRPPNELERDDQWSRQMFDRFLRKLLHAEAYQGQMIVLGCSRPIAQFLQKRAGIDIIAQTPHGEITIDYKIVRWPEIKDRAYECFCIEDLSCSIPGHEQDGWIRTGQCDILLYCFESKDHSALRCHPLPFRDVQAWYAERWPDLPEYKHPNPINGRNLWTRGRLAPIKIIGKDLKLVSFRVMEDGLVTELWGKPILDFMKSAP
jgi:hypothetical protein